MGVDIPDINMVVNIGLYIVSIIIYHCIYYISRDSSGLIEIVPAIRTVW